MDLYTAVRHLGPMSLESPLLSRSPTRGKPTSEPVSRQGRRSPRPQPQGRNHKSTTLQPFLWLNDMWAQGSSYRTSVGSAADPAARPPPLPVAARRRSKFESPLHDRRTVCLPLSTVVAEKDNGYLLHHPHYFTGCFSFHFVASRLASASPPPYPSADWRVPPHNQAEALAEQRK